MAKTQTKDATNKSNAIYNQAQNQLAPVISGLQSSQDSTRDWQAGVGASARGAFQNLQDTGGYDPTQLSKITGGFGNFADTGGFDDASKAAYLNQATSGVTGTYDVLAQQAQRNRAATGGYGAGGDISQLARQSSEAQAQATNNAMVGLNTQINQNKLAGLGGLQTTEASVAGGKEAGAAGMAGLFNTATNQLTQEGQQLLQAMGLQFGTQAEAIQFLQQLSKNPGVFGNIMQGLGTVAGDVKYTSGGLTV